MGKDHQLIQDELVKEETQLSLTLMNVDYREQIIIHFLFNLKTSIKQSELAEKVGIYYATIRKKLITLADLGLIYIQRREKEKYIMITEKGTQAYEMWRRTLVGTQIIRDIEKELKDIEMNNRTKPGK